MSEALLAHTNALLDEANRELVDSLGGASLCSVSKSGGRVDGAKYLEGRMSALREVRGAIQRDGDAALDSVRSSWQNQLEKARSREMGPDWIAYRAGGVDVVNDLTATFQRSTTS